MLFNFKQIDQDTGQLSWQGGSIELDGAYLADLLHSGGEAEAREDVLDNLAGELLAEGDHDLALFTVFAALLGADDPNQTTDPDELNAIAWLRLTDDELERRELDRRMADDFARSTASGEFVDRWISLYRGGN